VSCTVLSAFLASLVGGSLNSTYGRRLTLLLAAGFFVFGSLILGLAWDFWSLFLGRLTLGVGIGLASLTSPLYIAEIALSRKRGKLVTLNIVLVVVGQFTAGMIDGILSNVDEGWRFMLGLAILPSLIMFFGFLFLPESPRYLVIAGREEEALLVMKEVRYSDEEAINEIQEIKSNAKAVKAMEMAIVQYEITFSGKDASSELKWFRSMLYRVKNMISYLPTWRAMKLGCGLMLLQQLIGINTVMYYAATIYEMSGFDGKYEVYLLLNHFILTHINHSL